MVEAVNLKKVALAIIVIQCLGLSYAVAASPTPKPKHKVTIVKKKPVPVKTRGAAVKKKKTVASVKKRVVHTHVYHPPKRKVRQAPPKPIWPPKGFTSVGSAYARVPTGGELIGILSTSKDATSSINSCSADPKNPATPAFSCAAILVGATLRCSWWKVTSTVSGIDPADQSNRITLGEIATVQAGAPAKTIQTIFLVSPVPLQPGVRFSTIHALCGIGSSTDLIPSSSFLPAENAGPTPTPTPTNP